ncbi:MAG: Gfo/Idh/MocA family oxidoreductase [Patescibacteria group bacterium]
MLNVAIVGSGFGRYGLLPAFAAVPQCTVVAVCGKKTDSLRKDCRRFGVEHIYEDWRALLKNERIDAIALAVTPRAQYTISKAALRQGIHVFAEKPLAVDLAQANELLRLARKKRIVTAVDFTFPEIAAWQKVKRLLDAKTYGELRHITANWDFLSYDIAHKRKSWKTIAAEGGGALSFFFSHGLYYLEHFAGTISDVQSNFSYAKESLGGAEAGVDMLLTFQSGVMGSAHISCAARGLHRHQLLFHCARATIVLENEGSHMSGFTLTVYEKGARRIAVSAERVVKHQDPRVPFVKKIAARFVRSCRSGATMHPGFKEGVRVQELIAQIRSRHTGTKPRAAR